MDTYPLCQLIAAHARGRRAREQLMSAGIGTYGVTRVRERMMPRVKKTFNLIPHSRESKIYSAYAWIEGCNRRSNLPRTRGDEGLPRKRGDEEEAGRPRNRTPGTCKQGGDAAIDSCRGGTISASTPTAGGCRRPRPKQPSGRHRRAPTRRRRNRRPGATGTLSQSA